MLADVPHGAREITQEETFGPVVALSTFPGDEKTAVALANDSTYGLTASVYSGDAARAARVASQIHAGQVGINNNALSGARDIRSPFVGHKRSGYGSHSGTDGWRQFSVPKTLIYLPGAAADTPTEAPPRHVATTPSARPPEPPPRSSQGGGSKGQAAFKGPSMVGVALLSALAGAAIALLPVKRAKA